MWTTIPTNTHVDAAGRSRLSRGDVDVKARTSAARRQDGWIETGRRLAFGSAPVIGR